MIATAYRVFHFNEPVRVRTDMGETAPHHADMLRYDLAFCNPADVSIVAFPIFKSNRFGKTTMGITLERWRSFCMRLEPVETAEVSGDWIGYSHEMRAGVLEAVTLDQYLAKTRMKVCGWRHL